MLFYIYVGKVDAYVQVQLSPSSVEKVYAGGRVVYIYRGDLRLDNDVNFGIVGEN